MDRQMWRDYPGNLCIWACPGFTVSFRCLLSASVLNWILYGLLVLPVVLKAGGNGTHNSYLLIPPQQGSLGEKGAEIADQSKAEGKSSSL